MTVVRQEAVLFRDSLRNNLTMYKDIPDNELIMVLNSIGLDKFASKEALGEMITENGTNLSGGEKKRICLARALLRDTDVLILDEPLANLDETTAGKIEDLLLSIEGKLMLAVSRACLYAKDFCIGKSIKSLYLDDIRQGGFLQRLQIVQKIRSQAI